MGHLGLLPQTNKGKFKSKGGTDKEKKQLIKDSILLQNSGVFAIVLECIKMNTAKEITNKLTIPTIGIGASKYCDGQVLVIDDIINVDPSNYKPKFIKTYTNIEVNIINAVKNFTKDVKSKKFPSKKYSY